MPEPVTHTEWLAGVPALLAETAESWGLTLGKAYPLGAVGYAVRAELPDGTSGVLKLSPRHRESLQEADALERWDGDGAVRLYARDDERHALLLERCEPGSFLAASGDDTLGVLVELLPRLWKSGEGFRPLAEEAEFWRDHEFPQVRDTRLRDAATRYLEELVPTRGLQVLVHQDLHGENVLAAQRERWLAIDPKPLSAEREFSVAPIVRSTELGEGKREALRRLDRLTAELGLDRERALGWTIVQTVAWSGGSDYIEEHMEIAHWLLEAA